MPVPVFDAVSVHLKRSAVPVVAPKVNREVFEPIESDRLPEGAVTALHATDPAEGVAHVPSPLQKVVELADVPLFKLPTGRLPVTPPLELDARLIAGTSPDTIPAQVGAALTVPVPVCARNCLAAVVFPASRELVFAAEP